jgi:hypothetical protein
VAHPLMLRAIAAAKKKNDRIDAHKIADCLRCDFLPESYMASTEIRERRRTLRYRNLLVRQLVKMKNKIAVLLMEAGVSLTCRGSRPSGRAWARALGISHTWLQKLVRRFQADPSEMQREAQRGDSTFAQLTRAWEFTQRMKEDGKLRSSRGAKWARFFKH